LLSERPKLKLAIVGHTDTSGGLEANIAVSQERAQSVRLRLIEQHAVDPARVDAQGMGYLAPRASNRTEAGRTVNRRVEVIIVNEEG
jgi:outer membrane protein OmpA-like peptidoglycan-associated protein